jgi:alkylhydroperoxidase family enzyme
MKMSEQTGARIAPLSPDEARAAADAAGLPPGWWSYPPNQVTLRNPRVAAKIAQLTAVFLEDPLIEAPLRELVLMRIAWRTGCPWVWGAHWNLASQQFGVPVEKLAAVRDWSHSALFSPAEQAVLAAADDTIDAGSISDDTWKSLEAAFDGPSALLEFVAMVGTYQMWTQMLNTLRLPLDDSLPSWPPDGVAPRT